MTFLLILKGAELTAAFLDFHQLCSLRLRLSLPETL